MSQTDLEQRISVALTTADLKAAELAVLLEETTAAIVAADATAQTARECAYDPALSADPTQARAEMENAVLCSGRLNTLKPRLEAKLAELQAAETEDHWLHDFVALEGIQNKLADEFAQTYQRCATELVDCFARMADLAAELSRLHQARPSGVSLHLLGAELTARALTGFTRDQPSIVTQVVLPDFEHSSRNVWSPKPEINTTVFAPLPPDIRYTRRWFEAAAEQNQQRDEERKRVADFYDDQQRRREKRENADAEERRRQARR